MHEALKILNSKELGFIVVNNNQGLVWGFHRWRFKRLLQKKRNIEKLK